MIDFFKDYFNSLDSSDLGWVIIFLTVVLLTLPSNRYAQKWIFKFMHFLGYGD